MINIDIEHKILTSKGKGILKFKVNISEHHLWGVLGESGVGKTSLFRMIAGFIKPNKGIIQVGKTVFFNSSKKINLTPQKRNISFMFQDYVLFPNMSVEENIFFAQHIIKDKNFINSIIATFGLEALRKQKPFKLSGGQKQRVALACALAKQSNLLLLDEPTSAIDTKMREEIQNKILQDHKLRQSTILFISHNKNEINKMATYKLFMNTDENNIITLSKI